LKKKNWMPDSLLLLTPKSVKNAIISSVAGLPHPAPDAYHPAVDREHAKSGFEVEGFERGRDNGQAIATFGMILSLQAPCHGPYHGEDQEVQD
jgi:hypothetical protein